MKVLIIEDELVAAQRLKDMLEAYDPNIEVIEIIDSVVDAVNFLTTTEFSIDIIFMDIQLSDGLCFEIFEEVTIQHPILFTTAYDQYALKAFKLNTVDYLLKPIESNELEQSIKKFENIHLDRSSTTIDTQKILRSMERSISYKYRFLIKTSSGYIPVASRDIAYFYSEDKLTFLSTWECNRYTIEMSLEELKNRLDPKEFFKINRGFIVNHDAIAEIQYHLNYRLKLKLKPACHKDVFVSRNNIKKFKVWMES
jgi:two-component system, LytTR family, response regulator